MRTRKSDGYDLAASFAEAVDTHREQASSRFSDIQSRLAELEAEQSELTFLLRQLRAVSDG